MSLIPYRLRWANQFYAYIAGYFWIPCPVCGRYFGGHEWRDFGHTLWIRSEGQSRSGKGTCPRCPVTDA